MTSVSMYNDLEMKKPRNTGVPKSRQSPSAVGTGLPLSRATVLHIDDDRNDVELFRAAARKANAQFAIHNVSDGEQAMAYLNGRGIYRNRQLYPLPALILLDLKMPRATGFEVLRWIRNHPEVGDLPVIILSGSELQDDIQQAYATGADFYMVKPLGFNELVNLVKELNAAWVREDRGGVPLVAESSRAWQGSKEWLDGPLGNKVRP